MIKGEDGQVDCLAAIIAELVSIIKEKDNKIDYLTMKLTELTRQSPPLE